jgi:hypothetical protein
VFEVIQRSDEPRVMTARSARKTHHSGLVDVDCKLPGKPCPQSSVGLGCRSLGRDAELVSVYNPGQLPVLVHR